MTRAFAAVVLLLLTQSLWGQDQTRTRSSGLLAVVSPDDPHPLTNRQRQLLFRRAVFGPGIAFATLGAAVGRQLTDQPPDWEQGTSGYARRVADTYGQFLIQGSVHAGAAAAIGHDPRYVLCPCKGTWKRLAWSAMLGSFVARDRDGDLTFAYARVGSVYAGTMGAMGLWWPDRYSPLKDGFREGSQSLAFQGLFNVFKEFEPEIRRIYRRK